MLPICLITPPSAFLLDERVFITLGILRVAACLESAGHTVEMLDTSGISNFVAAVRDHVWKSRADVFGITATTPQLPAAVRIVEVIRQLRPSARIILGGPHVTLVNAAMKREKKLGIYGRGSKAFHQLWIMFNVLVPGDGDDAILLAIRPDAPKVIDADDPGSSLFLTNDRLEALPLPARHLVDVSSYHYSVDGEDATSLIAQLGCPFNCGFCGGRESPMLRRIRMRSTESVVDEILFLHRQFGFKGFMLYDDELNVNPKLVELMEGIHKLQVDLGVVFRLRGFIKSQLFTDEQAEAMRRAGFRWILVGFESGSPQILENINKKATREENTRCVEIARRHQLKVKALMSMGHPGESPATIKDSEDWLLAMRPDDFDMTIITTYPGTPYYDHAVQDKNDPSVWTYTCPKTGDRLHSTELDFTQVADYYKGDPEGGYHAYVWTDHITSADLVLMRNKLEANVREKLGIPFNTGFPATRYEHSMGQHGRLPSHILRTSDKK